MNSIVVPTFLLQTLCPSVCCNRWLSERPPLQGALEFKSNTFTSLMTFFSSERFCVEKLYIREYIYIYMIYIYIYALSRSLQFCVLFWLQSQLLYLADKPGIYSLLLQILWFCTGIFAGIPCVPFQLLSWIHAQKAWLFLLFQTELLAYLPSKNINIGICTCNFIADKINGQA